MSKTINRRTTHLLKRLTQTTIVTAVGTVLGMVGVGYQTGIAGSKRSMARPILVVSFGMVIVLIASLDRPDSGVMTVTQQPLVDLRDLMNMSAEN